MGVEKNIIPFKTGIWVTKKNGESRLVSSWCRNCGEIIFPRREHGYCLHCQQRTLEDRELSPTGVIVAVTKVMQSPAGGYYKGPVPYFFGLVDIDDEVRIETHFDGDATKLVSGAKVKLDIQTLYTDDDGNDVKAYTFRPI
jgi:uncharacterized OB-fold protein